MTRQQIARFDLNGGESTFGSPEPSLMESFRRACRCRHNRRSSVERRPGLWIVSCLDCGVLLGERKTA